MMYITNTKFGWDHSAYWQYLETVRDQMPANAYAFASDPRRHNLTSPDSLHDSWLDSWQILECSSQDKASGSRDVTIECRLLGPKHDRYFNLSYIGVRKYEIIRGMDSFDPPSRGSGHGDLLVHELLLLPDGALVHELKFSRGMTFTVNFEEFVEATYRKDN